MPGWATAPPSVMRAVPGESGAPDAAEPLGAESCDQRDVGERLRVGDECRCTVEPTFEWVWRLERRLRVTPGKRTHECRLLSGDEAVRDGGCPKFDATVSASPLRDRSLDGRSLTPGAIRDRDDRVARAERSGGEHCAVEDEVGRDAEECVVLSACGLTLDGVRHDDGPTPCCCHCP